MIPPQALPSNTMNVVVSTTTEIPPSSTGQDRSGALASPVLTLDLEYDDGTTSAGQRQELDQEVQIILNALTVRL